MQKAEICDKLDKGISGNRLASEYNVAKSTISYLRKHRNDAKKALPCKTQKSKGLSKSRRGKLEDAFYKWTLEQQTKNISLSQRILKDKAKQLYNDLYGTDDFRPSDKWLRNFKQRHNILLKHQFCESDVDTASTISIKSSKSPDSTSLSSEIEEKYEELGGKDGYCSGFEVCRHDRTISNPLHDYDDDDKTCWKQSEPSEDFATDTDRQSSAMLKKENESWSDYLISNEGSEEEDNENVPVNTYEGVRKNDSMSESSGNGDGDEMDSSVDFQNSFQRRGSLNQRMSSEENIRSDGSETFDESDLVSDDEIIRRNSYAALNSTESDSVSEMESVDDSTGTTNPYSRFDEYDDDDTNVGSDPNQICNRLRILLNADHEINRIISRLHYMGFIR